MYDSLGYDENLDYIVNYIMIQKELIIIMYLLKLHLI